MKLRPANRLLWLMLACIFVALAELVGWLPQPFALGALALVALVVAVDALALLRTTLPGLTRQMAANLALDAPAKVRVRVENARRAPVRCRIYDHHPESFAAQSLPLVVDVAGAGWTESHYRVRPGRRGDFEMPRTDLEVMSALGLWWRRACVANAQPVRVYPNFLRVAGYAQLAAEQRLDSLGVHRRRRRGEGMEFHQLRDYRPGDALARIDWRATARTKKLITREYQDERDQCVLFALDCGRRMRAADTNADSTHTLSHFDAALNAMLLLAYVASRQGDAVGAMTFGGEPRWLNPRKGRAALDELIGGTYDLEPGTHSPDYARTVAELARRQRKRALVVVITNARDEDASDLGAMLASLRKRHVVLLANLREEALDDALEAPVPHLDAALRVAAVNDYLARRAEVLRRLAANGARTLDATPATLSVGLVNRYLEIKAQGAL